MKTNKQTKKYNFYDETHLPFLAAPPSTHKISKNRSSAQSKQNRNVFISTFADESYLHLASNRPSFPGMYESRAVGRYAISISIAWVDGAQNRAIRCYLCISVYSFLFQTLSWNVFKFQLIFTSAGNTREFWEKHTRVDD